MDRDAALRLLSQYIEQVIKASQMPLLSKQRASARSEINGRLREVNQVLRGLSPDMASIRAASVGSHVDALPRARRALDSLNGWKTMTTLAITCDVPVLPLSLLDPVVREVAHAPWRAEQFKYAVSEAATNLNSFAQRRLECYDIYDIKLMNEAFSDDPPKPSRPRLRCPGDRRHIATKDQQSGARQLAAGTFLAIRNPAAHMTGEWNPVTAFHYLTFLSQIAQYFRYWDVIRYTPPPPDPEVLTALAAAMAQKSGALKLPSASSDSSASR